MVLLILNGRCSAVSPATCPECVTLSVGRPIYAGGPVGNLYDTPFTAINIAAKGIVRGYSANGATDLVSEGTSVLDLLPSPVPVGLAADPNPDALDHCGAWLNSALYEPETGIVRGFYHEEWECNYADDFFTNKSIAYAESTDGGRTFTKPGHPDNAIILAPYGNTTTAHQCGEGDHSAVRLGDYYYLWFLQWDPAPPNEAVRVGLARSAVSDGGVPGSWWKYYQGDFTQPGRHGMSDAIANITGSTVVGHHLAANGTDDAYDGFASIGVDAPSNYGMPTLAFSTDGIAWQAMTAPLLVVTSFSWNRTGPVGELIAYPGLTGANGTQPGIGSEFFMTYTYLQPGEDFSQRYFVLRPVSLVLNPAPVVAPAPSVRVELDLYFAGADWWATTALIPPKLHYGWVETLGALSTEPITLDGSLVTLPLYDCYIPMWQDHMVGLGGDQCGGGGTALLRTLGYAYTEPLPAIGAVTPLYRCFDSAADHHSVSTQPDCQGRGKTEFLIGYLLAP